MTVVQVQLALTSSSWDMFHRLALDVFLRVQLAGFPPKPKPLLRESEVSLAFDLTGVLF